MQPTTFDLFADNEPVQQPRAEQIGEQSWVLRGFALPQVEQLLTELEAILAAAPLRHMVTPGGFSMSVGTSSCGQLGWITDRSGYRYSSVDPLSGLAWPSMPAVFADLAHEAAERAGFPGFQADSCLINQYVPGAKMSLHQDRDERDYGAPIVSVSLGLAAMFQLGGLQRSDRPLRVPLLHGDVMVWGGVDRLRFHGVLPLKQGMHPVMGPQRINFTLRKAG